MTTNSALATNGEPRRDEEGKEARKIRDLDGNIARDNIVSDRDATWLATRI